MNRKRIINENLIAPCGMNCAICMAHLREKNKCAGCNQGPTNISCLRCKIRNCTERKGKYCFDCDQFPCDKLKHLDKRYRTKYGMSEIENLELIRNKGIDKLLEREQKKWSCKKCGRLRSCHNGLCYNCDDHKLK